MRRKPWTDLDRPSAVRRVLAVSDHGPQVVVVDLLDVRPRVLVHLDLGTILINFDVRNKLECLSQKSLSSLIS
jgi:hypothetical protein